MIYWENGFYLDQDKENRRKEISKERWLELLEAQRGGLEIYTDESGYPNVREHRQTQTELREQRGAEIKVLFEELDADINACIDGTKKAKSVSAYRGERAALHNELRQLIGKDALPVTPAVNRE